MTSLMVIAAHTDDEALGCGGTIAAHAARGDDVHAVFLTDGVGARGGAMPSWSAEHRLTAAAEAAKVMGLHSTRNFDFPDNRLDTVALLDIVQAIEDVIEEYTPEVIYTHHAHDLNVDHRICHQAVLTACRPQPGHFVRAIYGFEVVSSTEWAFSSSGFHPRHFVDISEQRHAKIAALSCYAQEMRPPPHARAIDTVMALAQWRGATVGVDAAEAFEIIRQVVKLDKA